MSLVGIDTWHVTPDTWHVTGDPQHVTMTRDMWQVGGGEHSPKISKLHSSYCLGVRGDMWHLTCDTWHLRCGTWQMICVTWHTGGDEHCVKILGPLLLRFGFEGVLKILNKRMNQLINDKGVCRSARLQWLYPPVDWINPVCWQIKPVRRRIKLVHLVLIFSQIWPFVFLSFLFFLVF